MPSVWPATAGLKDDKTHIMNALIKQTTETGPSDDFGVDALNNSAAEDE